MRKAGRGLFNFVIMPYFRSVSNAVNWVARTTSSLARGLGRGTMATLRGLGHGIVSTAQWGWRNTKAVGRGIVKGTAAAFRGLGHGIVSSAEWAGRNLSAASRAITGGARWSDLLSELFKNYSNPVAIYKNYQKGKTLLPDWAEALCDTTIVTGAAALTFVIGGSAMWPYITGTAGAGETANELATSGQQAATTATSAVSASPSPPTQITEWGRHALSQWLLRDQGAGFNIGEAIDAFNNPVTNPTFGLDEQGRPFWEFIGRNARMLINPAGKVITVIPRNETGARYPNL